MRHTDGVLPRRRATCSIARTTSRLPGAGSRRSRARARAATRALSLAPARARAHRTQGGRRQHGAGPGAEVLGGELVARDLPEVFVDVGRVDRRAAAVLVQVLEQLLARQIAAAPDDARESRSSQIDLVEHAALAAKVKSQLGARRRDVTILAASSGRTSRSSRAYSSLPTRMNVVSSRRTTVASTLLARQAGRLQIGGDALPDRRQRAREGDHLFVLGLVPRARASAGDSGTACARARRGPWPGCARRRSGRSRRRATRAEWPGGESGPAVRGRAPRGHPHPGSGTARPSDCPAAPSFPSAAAVAPVANHRRGAARPRERPQSGSFASTRASGSGDTGAGATA